jgi:hypothetical protein
VVSFIIAGLSELFDSVLASEKNTKYKHDVNNSGAFALIDFVISKTERLMENFVGYKICLCFSTTLVRNASAPIKI